MEPLTNPHDRFFREVLSREDAARDFLQHYLPLEVANLLDFSHLEIKKDSYIDKDLQAHYADLLYQVGRREGEELFVYILFEHKSYPEPHVAFQMLRYMVKIWEQTLKDKGTLAPIMPIVLYHGRTRWRVGETLGHLFDLPQALEPFFSNYHYWLCDLSRYSDEEIKGGVILQVALMLLKYIFRDDLRDQLGDILALIRELTERESALEYLQTVLRYVTGGTDRLTEEELYEVIEGVFSEGGQVMPTIAEKWIQQGFEEGMQRGKQEGQHQTASKMLHTILRMIFPGSRPERYQPFFDKLSLDDLEQLSEVALKADRLADFETALEGFLGEK